MIDLSAMRAAAEAAIKKYGGYPVTDPAFVIALLDRLEAAEKALAEPAVERVATLFGSLPVYDTPPAEAPLLTLARIRELADKADEGQEPSEFMLAFARAIEQAVRRNAGLK